MRLQYASFSLPLFHNSAEEDDLNRFLRGHRVLQTKKELIQTPESQNWAILVEYLDAPDTKDSPFASSGGGGIRTKVDYKEVLSPEDFSIFSKLRDVRKKLADEAGIPVYAVCTNEQLSIIAREKPRSVSDCRKIGGIGQSKAEKYIPALIEILSQPPDITGEAPPSAAAESEPEGPEKEDLF